MAYISKWESLSEAVDRIMKSTGRSLEVVRADLCAALSDGALEIRAKLASHTTRLQKSTVAVDAKHLQIPTKLRPDDIDWTCSRPEKPWLLLNPPPRHQPGPWHLGQVEVSRESATKLFSLSKAEAGPEPIQPALRARKRRETPQLRAAELIIEHLYPNGVPAQHALPNKKLVQQVNSERKGQGDISPDTILRAAGRRRK